MNVKERVDLIIKEVKRVPADGSSEQMFRDFLERQIKEALTQDRRRTVSAIRSLSNPANRCLKKAVDAVIKKIEKRLAVGPDWGRRQIL